MNNEIKEIFEKIKINSNHSNDTSHYNRLNLKECNLLLNYITNLQERIDKAIEYIEKEYKENIIIADYCDNPITPQDLYNDILNILKGGSDENI